MSIVEHSRDQKPESGHNQANVPEHSASTRDSGKPDFWSSGAKRGLDSILVLVILIGIWWILSLDHNNKILFYLSSPPAVGKALISSLESRYFWVNFWSTAEATLVSFVIGSLLGILAGFTVTALPRLELALEPFASTLNALPRIALAPLFIALLGISQNSKIAVGASLVVFVLYYNVRSGVQSVDRDWLLLARSLGYSKKTIYRKILVPVAWPSLFTGLRLGFTYGLLGVVSTEIIAARSGLGQLVVEYATDLNFGPMYAVLIAMALMAGGIYGLTGIVEKRIMRWNSMPL